MTIEQSVCPPFHENAQVVIKTNENYEMQNGDDVVDVFEGSGITIQLPKNPVPGQTHRVVAPVSVVTVLGNGRGIAGGLTLVPAGTFVDYVFTNAIIDLIQGGWVASCCAEAPLR
jgi:hypothetical protein